MNRIAALASVVGLAAIAGSIVIAQPTKEPAKPGTPAATKPATQPDKIPPGMSEADMKACEAAATPGPMHQRLARSIGVWSGKATMWMTPDAPPMQCEVNSTVSSFLDGRFVKCETTGNLAGMPFNGFGLYGYDNVAQKLQATWVDNCTTSMGTGTGAFSADNKTLTWNYTFSCPINKKPTALREVQTITGPDTMTMQMFGNEPHSGKEFKMMEIQMTRKAGTGPTATVPTDQSK